MTSKKRRRKRKKIIRLCLLALAALLIIGLLIFAAKQIFTPKCEHIHGSDGKCTLCGADYPHSYSEGYCTMCGSVDPDYIFPDEIIDFSLICGGDIMAHRANLESAYQNDAGALVTTAYSCYQNKGSFDFTDNYTWVKELVSSADLALVNLETTLSGGSELSGDWSRFNSPDSLASAVKDAGFDIVFTCNNHSLDYGGLNSLIRTVQVCEDAGLETVGSRDSLDDNRSIITEVNGVRVGIVAYTYETSPYGTARALNGVAMQNGAWDYLNSYRYTEASDGTMLCCDEDKQAIKSEIEWCRQQGAEVVIAYFHWDASNEYKLNVTALQKDLARFAAESGADIIFGSHPHRIQEIEILEISDENGSVRRVPVYYSLGNYISNQRYETMDAGIDTPENDYATEQEIMAYLTVSYNRTKGTTEIKTVQAVPLYVDKYYQNSHLEYRIIPLTEGYESLVTDLQVSGNYDRAARALRDITELLGEEYIYR